MTKERVPRPTPAELDILTVLWRKGPSTVREINETLSATRGTSAYTTTLKFLQIMMEKGLVTRDESRQTHVYQAEFAQEDLVRDLLDRVFDGSAKKLVMQALTSKKASSKELQEIRTLLDELEFKSKRRNKG